MQLIMFSFKSGEFVLDLFEEAKDGSKEMHQRVPLESITNGHWCLQLVSYVTTGKLFNLSDPHLPDIKMETIITGFFLMRAMLNNVPQTWPLVCTASFFF